MKSEETYTSHLHTHVHFFIYEPKVVLRVKGVIFIHHDVGENANRYDHFAQFMLNQGYVVIVSDTVGHGRSLIDYEQGYFGEGNPTEALLADMHHLQKVIYPRYPDTCHYYIGVGFGASLVRLYASRYGDYFHGMILISPNYSLPFSKLEVLRLHLMELTKGDLYHPVKRNEIIRQRFAKHFKGSNLAWMSNDPQVISRYREDPVANFTYTVKGYLDVLSINKLANEANTTNQIPEYMSINILAGRDDPVTHFGRDAKKIYQLYKDRGIRDLSLKLYDHRRHAILRDKNKEEIYKDILNWLNERSFY